MVVVLRVRRPLVADHRLPSLHPVDEAEALEVLEDAVDARAAHLPRVGLREGALDLHGRERAALASEQLEHRLPGAAALAPGLRQRGLRVLDPG